MSASKRDLLTMVEHVIGYTADDVICEYMKGDYGDPGDWSKQSIIDAELNGDSGDILRQRFGESPDYGQTIEIWAWGLMRAWENAEGLV